MSKYNHGRMFKRIRLFFSSAMALVSLALLAWGLWPESRSQEMQFIQPHTMMVPAGEAIDRSAVMESRKVTLEWPSSLRIGDMSTIRLVFEPVAGEVLAPQPDTEYTNVYLNYNLMAEGRLEVAGMSVNPPNPRLESLPAGQTIKFTWQIGAREVTTYPARAWLLLHFLPLKGGAASELPIFVRDLDLRATSLLGLSGPSARPLGTIGIMSSLVMSYDLLINFFKKSQRSPWIQGKTL
jgi:hypothetical protein